MAEIEAAWEGLIDYFDNYLGRNRPKWIIDRQRRIAYERKGEQGLTDMLLGERKARAKAEFAIFRVLHQLRHESEFCAQVCDALREYELLAKIRESRAQRRPRG
jgi:hypothetical protein